MSKQNQKGFGAVEAILIFVIIGALVGVGWWVYSRNNKENSNTQSTNNSITNFDECVASGNPVAESYPEQCSANGQTFVNEKSNLVTTLNDNEAVELLKVGDEEKLPADIPDSFKQYMKKLLAKNDDNKKDGCSYIGYRVSKYSNVNVAGGLGDYKKNGENLESCLTGANVVWYLKDDIWNEYGYQSIGGCEEIDETTIYEEFIPDCVDLSSDSQDAKSNPNGSIEQTKTN